MGGPALVLHGGAGSWDVEYRELSASAIEQCARRGWEALTSGTALDAVVESVKCMEDSGYLNAGAGSVPNVLGYRELDAGVMDSSGLLGAVAAVRATKNPVVLARRVAELTPHVILAGEGADELARRLGLDPLPPMPEHVARRYRQALDRLARGEARDAYYARLRESAIALGLLRAAGDTVGAVALDSRGRLAAATSTGGVILKLPGRVGDTPIPGAGFYASDAVACSSTGYGESIIRFMPCLRLDQLVREGLRIEEAARRVIELASSAVGPDTMGFVAVDGEGRRAAAYNTRHMLVAFVEEGSVSVAFSP
ncbi:MAG: isoaspartyl peptidase/L-asparaginase [Desulfurococcaceae archaeon]